MTRLKSAFSNTKERLAVPGRESLAELLRVYHDLERTLKSLKSLGQGNHRPSAVRQLDLPRLIERLSVSKRKLERKIHNTLLLEKEGLKRNLRRMLRQNP